MRRVIYPGTFDPVTYGHLDLITRICALFDEVIVAVAHNEGKHPTFSVEERVALMRDVLGPDTGVRVIHFGGLLVDLARDQQADAIVRGLRAISDFEFELQMAHMNRRMSSTVETIFVPSKEDTTYISSRVVKEIARLGGDIRPFVPPQVAEALAGKLNK